jgi:multiple sugar transport system permease protein
MSAVQLFRASLRHTVLAMTALLSLIPFIWMISLSLKPRNEIFQAAFTLLPDNWAA